MCSYCGCFDVEAFVRAEVHYEKSKEVKQKEELQDCVSCGEEMPLNECPQSQRPCGHHCNHSWTHEKCCWCGLIWEPEGEGK